MPKQLEEISQEDIELMRKEFNKELQEFYKDRQVITEWDTKRIEKVIEAMESGNGYYYIRKYKIKMLNGKKVLINRKHENSSKIIRIVPSEEYFDIILDAHLKTGHGGRDKIIQLLKRSVYIPTIIISLFPKLCKICKSKGYVRKSLKKDTCDYKRGLLHIIDMTKTPCGPFKYIMYYQDLKTGLLFLRALTNDTHKDVAMELTKIFLEFGGPVVLCTTRGETFTKNILEAFKNLHPSINLLPGKTIDKEEIEDSESRVKSNLRTWSTENNSSWVDGIPFVQFNINSSFQEDLDGTPFQAVFGFIPKIGVDTLELPEGFAKGWKDEDDAINWQASEAQRKRRRIGTKGLMKTGNDRKPGEGFSSDEERAWCWVCEKDDDGVTFNCDSCSGSIHQGCGKIYKHGDYETFECKMCSNEQNKKCDVKLVTVEMEKDPISIKTENPGSNDDSY